jgi:hypothetical protein
MKLHTSIKFATWGFRDFLYKLLGFWNDQVLPLSMTSAKGRRALPFSAEEKILQEAPYIYTSGTVSVKEQDADYVFYQTWSDGRVEQKNVDVIIISPKVQ